MNTINDLIDDVTIHEAPKETIRAKQADFYYSLKDVNITG